MTNFVGGALAGIITSLFQLVNNAPGTASPIPGLLVLFGFNDVVKVTIAAILCGIVTTIVGYIGSIVFRKYPIRSADEIRGVTSEEGCIRKELFPSFENSFLCCVTVNEIISAVFQYISATRIISAIF